MPGTASQKSNHDLSRELRILLRTQELRPPIWTAKRGEAQRGAVEYGARWLHGQMSVPGLFGVHPRCSRLVEALEKYDGRDNDWKDPVDALRYAIKHILSDYATQTRSVTLRVG
jgi:hypothetical protein